MRGGVVFAGAAAMGLLMGWAFGGAGDGIKAGSTVLHPFADVSVTHDSNTSHSRGDRKADVYAQGATGLRFLYSSLRFSLAGSGFAGARQHADQSESDFNFVGQSLGAAWNEDRGGLAFAQSYRRLKDIDMYGSEYEIGGISQDAILDVAARREREIFEASLALDRHATDKLDLNVGGRYVSVEYSEGDLRDLQSVFGIVEGAFRMTPKSAAFVTGKYGQMNDRAADGTAIIYAGHLGLKTIGTDKLVFRVGAGAQRFDPRDGGDNRTVLSFDGSATWAATERVFVQAGAHNGISKSILAANEGVEYSILRLSLLAHANKMLSVSLAGAYRQDNYLDREREDEGIGLRARLDFTTLSDSLRAYWEVASENVDSSESARNYSRMRMTLGVNLKY